MTGEPIPGQGPVQRQTVEAPINVSAQAGALRPTEQVKAPEGGKFKQVFDAIDKKDSEFGGHLIVTLGAYKVFELDRQLEHRLGISGSMPEGVSVAGIHEQNGPFIIKRPNRDLTVGLLNVQLDKQHIGVSWVNSLRDNLDSSGKYLSSEEEFGNWKEQYEAASGRAQKAFEEDQKRLAQEQWKNELPSKLLDIINTGGQTSAAPQTPEAGVQSQETPVQQQ